MHQLTHLHPLDRKDHLPRMVWVIDAASRRVTVHRSRDDVTILGEDDVLGGGDVLPGFQLPVRSIFAR